MELDRRHLHRPDHVGRMGHAELVGVAVVAREVHAYGLDPRRGAVRQPLLVDLLAVDAVGEAVQHARPVVERVDDPVGHAQVVVGQVELGLAAGREVDPVRVADLDDPVADLELDPLGRHVGPPGPTLRAYGPVLGRGDQPAGRAPASATISWRRDRKRTRVETALASTSTPTSSAPAGSVTRWCSAQSDPLVRASPTPKAISPPAWCLSSAVAAADAEGQPAVGRGVGDRGDQQGDQVGRLGAGDLAQPEVEQEVRERAEHADPAEPDQLAEHPARHPGHGRRHLGVAAELGPQPGDRDAAGARSPGSAGRRRPDPAWRWPRCRPGCPGRRPSPPAPRGSAARRAGRGPAARCRRTSCCPRPAAAGRPPPSRRMALKPHWASENEADSAPRRIRL